jgi:hypothetical protein
MADDRYAAARALGTGDDVEVKTTVNGSDVATVASPSRMLIDFLREDLGLCGTKRSCDVQICGACTVLVDDRPVSSCCTPLAGAHGRSVTTIEGIADPASVHAETYRALEQSFVLKDLEQYRRLPHHMEQNPALFDFYPRVLNEAAREIFTVDGTPKREKERAAVRRILRERPMLRIARDLYGFWRTVR